MFLWENRQAAYVQFIDGFGNPVEHSFLLDTGAIMSTMTRDNAELHGIHDKSTISDNAIVGGFVG